MIKERLTIAFLSLVLVFGVGVLAAQETQWGTGRFVEYIPGTLPIVISAPHGGLETPELLPDRPRGVFYTDLGTLELARMISDEMHARTGNRPHVIINRLKRRKLDPNRDIGEAAQGTPLTETAWREYHEFIDSARAAVSATFGTGLYIDLHGHANKLPRVELGYNLTSDDLANDDAVLDDIPYPDVSSLWHLIRLKGTAHSRLLRDSIGFGALLTKRGIAATPSPEDPKPNDQTFYAGGYSTRRHTADDGLNIFGFQIELPETVRTTQEAREELAPKLADAILEFLALNTPELLRIDHAN